MSLRAWLSQSSHKFRAEHHIVLLLFRLPYFLSWSLFHWKPGVTDGVRQRAKDTELRFGLALQRSTRSRQMGHLALFALCVVIAHSAGGSSLEPALQDGSAADDDDDDRPFDVRILPVMLIVINRQKQKK